MVNVIWSLRIINVPPKNYKWPPNMISEHHDKDSIFIFRKRTYTYLIYLIKTNFVLKNGHLAVIFGDIFYHYVAYIIFKVCLTNVVKIEGWG